MIRSSVTNTEYIPLENECQHYATSIIRGGGKYGFVVLWRYRVEQIRIICLVDQENQEIIALAIGKRDKIYSSILFNFSIVILR